MDGLYEVRLVFTEINSVGRKAFGHEKWLDFFINLLFGSSIKTSLVPHSIFTKLFYTAAHVFSFAHYYYYLKVIFFPAFGTRDWSEDGTCMHAGGRKSTFYTLLKTGI